jgi:hypothetical protein
MRRTMRKPKLPSNVQPRGLNLDQASEYWGVCPSTFKKLVKLGIAPGPIDMADFDRNIYDRLALDAAMTARSLAAGNPDHPLTAQAAEPERVSG